MKIGICDDDILYLNYLLKSTRQYFSTNQDITVSAFNPDQLSKQIEKAMFPFDLLITDIDMGNKNGIELAKRINEINSSCIIIFLSNYINYATEVYDVLHIYFVLKSEAGIRLPKALDKAMKIYNDQRSNHIIIRYQNIEHIIPLKEIIYIEALGRYLYIHDRKQSLKCINSLKDIFDELNNLFIRCHNSYIVNMDCIRSVSRTGCILSSGITIPVSHTYSKNFQAAYVKYVSGKLF